MLKTAPTRGFRKGVSSWIVGDKFMNAAIRISPKKENVSKNNEEKLGNVLKINPLAPLRDLGLQGICKSFFSAC